MHPIYNDKVLLKRRRELRRNQTDAEKVIWGMVRNKKIFGLKFFRQYSVGSYILDFFCPAIRLCIEADGGQHNNTTSKQYDQTRTDFLKQQNIGVIRFWNNDILQNREGVHQTIVETINKLLPPSS